jgi:leader peptidase (prepilin peptidase)/N-methyltransferase
MGLMHFGVLAGFAFVLGASVGSFLNVCVWRLPRGMNVLRPASRCPGCGNAIALRDNVPVLGWLWLRGRCRRCAGPISARYPMVEAAVGLAFAAIFVAEGVNDPLEHGAPSALSRLAFHTTAVSVLITVALIDADSRRAARSASGSAELPVTGGRRSRIMFALGAVASAMAAPAAASAGDLIGGALWLGLFVVLLRRFFFLELASVPSRTASSVASSPLPAVPAVRD